MKKFDEFLKEVDLIKIERVCEEIKYKATVGSVHRAHEGAYEGIREELDKNPAMALDYGIAASMLLEKEDDHTILYLAFPISHGNSEMAAAASYSRLLKGKKAFEQITGSLDDIEFSFISNALSYASNEDVELLISSFSESKWYSQLLNLYLNKPDRRLLETLDLVIASNESVSRNRLRLLTTIIRVHFPDLIEDLAGRILKFDKNIQSDFLKEISSDSDPILIEKVQMILNGPECVTVGKSFQDYLKDSENIAQHDNIEKYPILFYGIENQNRIQLLNTVGVLAKHITKDNLDSAIRFTRANIGTGKFIRSEFQSVVAEIISVSKDCEILSWASTLAYFWTNDEIAQKAILRMLKPESFPECFNMFESFRKRLSATGLKSTDFVFREMLIERLLNELDYSTVLKYFIQTGDSRLVDCFEAAAKINRVNGVLSQELAQEFAKRNKDIILHVYALAKKHFYKTDLDNFRGILKTARPELKNELST